MALGIGLSGSGMLVFYYLGVMSVLQQQGEVPELLLLFGSWPAGVAQQQLLLSTVAAALLL